jgi:phage-related protein
MDKPLRWMGKTRKELKGLSQDLRDEIGHALRIAQQGSKANDAISMKGKLRNVIEIRVDEDSDTYRTMYTTEFEGVIYVLDVFKKKSKKGIATPKEDLDRIAQRLKAARSHYEEYGPPPS